MYALFICLLGSLFYLYEFFIRLMPEAMTHQLMSSFHIDAAGLGVIASMFFYGYTPMQIPAGILLDRIGPRYMLAISFILCAISLLFFGLTHNTILAGAMRFLTGITASTAFISALMLGANWLNRSHYATYVGSVQLLGCIGAILGLGPVALAVRETGWQTTIIAASIIGIIIGIVILIFVRNQPKHVKPTETYRHKHNILKTIMKDPQLWATGLVAFSAWAPITIFAALWAASFFEVKYHIGAIQASTLISITWVGIAIGGPFLGWLSGHLKNRRTPLYIGLSLGLIAAVTLIYGGKLSNSLLWSALFLLGIAAGGQSVSFGLIIDNTPDYALGTASGFNNMCIVIGGIILAPLAGFILRWTWNGHLSHGAPIYSLHSYHLALIMVPLCYVLGLITTKWLIKETHCEHIDTRKPAP